MGDLQVAALGPAHFDDRDGALTSDEGHRNVSASPTVSLSSERERWKDKESGRARGGNLRTRS